MIVPPEVARIGLSIAAEAEVVLLLKQARRDGAAAERDRIIAVIEAEGKRLVTAAMNRMTCDTDRDQDMVTQVMRGSTIGNLARQLPDLLGGES